MPSTSQIRANRKNSQHSTGPTTESGKQTSSLNSLKHGLASSQLIIPGESEEEFNSFLTSLIAEHQPTTLTETLLVQDMAKYHWLVDRAIRLQSDAIGANFSDLDKIAPTLTLLIRYQTANERAFQRSFAALNAMRKAAKQEIGSASKSAAKTAKHAASAMDAAQKKRYDDWYANMIRDCQKPVTVEQAIAQGFTLNTATGNWEKTIS